MPNFIWRYGDPELGRELLGNEWPDELPRNRDCALLVHYKMYCVAGCLLGLGISRAGLQKEKRKEKMFCFVFLICLV